jgi:selenocysteine-specific translation elongation factor
MNNSKADNPTPFGGGSFAHLVSVPLDPRISESIGKKGSQNGITFYNRRAGDDVIVCLSPTSIADKFYAAVQTIMLASQVVVSTENPDQLFGEVVVACAMLGKRMIFTDDNDVAGLLSGVGAVDYAVSSRDELIKNITQYKGAAVPLAKRVDLDKAFPVKGLGTVALGIVTGGTLSKHDELYHSSGKKVLVRSIQSLDVDIDSAEIGTRVGIALKNIEPDEIASGDLLTENECGKASAVTAGVVQSGIAKEDMVNGNRYIAVSNFSYSNAKVDEVDPAGGKIKLTFERGMTLLDGDRIVLLRQKAPRAFAVCSVLDKKR